MGVLVSSSLGAVQSDELLVDDEEYGLEGGRSPPDLLTSTSPSASAFASAVPISSRRRRSSDLDSDSKVQFSLEHAFGDSHFSLAGTFTARLKTSSHGSRVLLLLLLLLPPSLLVCLLTKLTETNKLVYIRIHYLMLLLYYLYCGNDFRD
ncbi:hypothetical protein CsSME_00012731 [Camellia sinensis var. sinensis]